MAHRVKHKVQSTMDSLIKFEGTIGLSGSVATPTLSCSLIAATDMHVTVSGTSPGVVTLMLPPSVQYPQLIKAASGLQCHSSSSVDFGGRGPTKVHYKLEPLGFVWSSGSVQFGNAVGSSYQNIPGTVTPTGNAYYQWQIIAMTTGSLSTGAGLVSGTLVDPVDASVAVATPVADIWFDLLFRDTTRIV